MSPFFPVPVKTQEPLTVRGHVTQIRGNRIAFTGAELTATNPMLHTWAVPMGSNWRVISIIVRWYQAAADQQTLSVGLSQAPGVATSDIIYDSLRTAINANTASIHQVIATIGGSNFNYAVANGVGNYNTTFLSLPDIWLGQGQEANLAFHDANVGDSAICYISYEEEVIV